MNATQPNAYTRLTNRVNASSTICNHVVNVELHSVPLSQAEARALESAHLAALDTLRNFITGELTAVTTEEDS